MKYYLSSYNLGNKENTAKFVDMCKDTNKKVAYINNALDYSKEVERLEQSIKDWILSLQEIGLEPELLDLREYFGKEKLLEEKLQEFDILRVRWWNTFVLLQAMKLSWLDELIKRRHKDNESKIYAWFSAWVCALCPNLKGLTIVDDPNQKPYWDDKKIIREWLWILPYAVAPHYKSDHFESADIDKEVELMIDNKMLFIALRDWEAIIIE